MSSNSLLIIAGEKSGEEHALSFLGGLKEKIPNLEIFGVGGDELKEEGMELLYHLNDFSTWGISEAIKRIPFYFKALKRVEEEVVKRNCKAAILIDFQTFNMALAKRLQKNGVKVFYYVAPQAWAWKSYRTKALARDVHSLFTIIPFEKQWFLERGVSQVYSVPHPLTLSYEQKLTTLKKKNYPSSQLNLLLLPGSRKFEVRHLLPIFMETVQRLKKERGINLSLVQSPSIPLDYYRTYLDEDVKIYKSDEIAQAMSEADLALAASGTVTLLCALFSVPTVVAYKSSLLNQLIYESFISYTGPISLANIVHEQMIFPEFIQDSCEPYNLSRALLNILEDESKYNEIQNVLFETKNMLEGEGLDFCAHIANAMMESDD